MQCKKNYNRETGFVVLLYSQLKVPASLQCLQPTTTFKVSNKKTCFFLFLSWVIRFGESVHRVVKIKEYLLQSQSNLLYLFSFPSFPFLFFILSFTQNQQYFYFHFLRVKTLLKKSLNYGGAHPHMIEGPKLSFKGGFQIHGGLWPLLAYYMQATVIGKKHYNYFCGIYFEKVHIFKNEEVEVEFQ